MASGQRVLVVDGLSETEEVLKAVLEPRGLQVDRVPGRRGGCPPTQAAPPHLVVLHEDEAPSHRTRKDDWRGIPRVIIGSTELSPRGEETAGCHYLRKPFQYRELIQAIERLLTASEREG